MPTNDPIARAFELAREGKCRTVTEIRKVLQREGYANLESHFSGRSLSRQLGELISKGGGN
ncbi:hypothetical protein WG901_22780 [Novosphingobium sp. PS1R-30]|uniref:KfrA N-terminal DNA-binding domain-containing protein n=1 Tax=Novosphingobium anseongense TaxID=3133436 RepID=A0ABU8S2K1_9SPHN